MAHNCEEVYSEFRDIDVYFANGLSGIRVDKNLRIIVLISATLQLSYF
jgi:hypothetical protein